MENLYQAFDGVLGDAGMYPGIDPGPPGSDCAGTITHTGAGGQEHGLCIGDRVVGLAHGCLGTATVAPAATLVKLPPGLTPQACPHSSGMEDEALSRPGGATADHSVWPPLSVQCI